MSTFCNLHLLQRQFFSARPKRFCFLPHYPDEEVLSHGHPQDQVPHSPEFPVPGRDFPLATTRLHPLADRRLKREWSPTFQVCLPRRGKPRPCILCKGGGSLIAYEVYSISSQFAKQTRKKR